VLRLQLFQLRGDEIKSLVPGRALEHAVTALDERVEQPVRVVDLQVGRHAFRAEASLVDGEIVTRLEADDVFVLDEQVHAALHGAVGAVRRHDLVYHAVGAPAAVRRVVQVRPELGDDLF
jgi:hypothetical protein